MQTRRILERLYRVPRYSRRERLVKRLREFRRTFVRWLEYQSFGVAITTAALAVLFGLTGYYYNMLLVLEYDIQLAWTRVEAGEQRRNHVTRNLAQLVRFYTRHEKELFKDVTKLRTGDAVPSPGAQLLGRLNAVAEQYPNLRLSNSVQLFTTTVVSSETEIAYYIIAYNDAIRTYGTALNSYPAKVFGKLLGFEQYRYYKPENPARLVFQELEL